MSSSNNNNNIPARAGGASIETLVSAVRSRQDLLCEVREVRARTRTRVCVCVCVSVCVCVCVCVCVFDIPPRNPEPSSLKLETAAEP